jgi:hypothetical protein
MFRRLTGHQARRLRKSLPLRSTGRRLYVFQLWFLVAALLASLGAGVRQLVTAPQKSERMAEPAPVAVPQPLKLVSQSEDD